jgi:hypothetical protein
MTRLISVTTIALMFAGTPLYSAQQGTPPGKHKKHPNTHDEALEGGRTNVAVKVTWSTHDVNLVRTSFAPQYRGRRLPPGLAKKYARTGQLPPGWQKRMEPIPVAVERDLAPLPPGHRRGVIEGVAVIYDTHGLIIDVATLF